MQHSLVEGGRIFGERWKYRDGTKGCERVRKQGEGRAKQKIGGRKGKRWRIKFEDILV